MTYERTVAGSHRIYSINVSSTPTKIFDLLVAQGYEENYDTVTLQISGGIPYYEDRSREYEERDFVRVAVDGYVYCPTAPLFVAHAEKDGSQGTTLEPVVTGLKYGVPVVNWPHETYIATQSGTAQVFVHIFFS